MNRQASALVVNSDAGMLRLLQAVLQDQQITTHCVRTCEEARAAVSGGEAPEVIFAGTSFSDGTWREVLSMAEKASPLARVVIITTGRQDIGLCLEVAEKGTADIYIVPPFAVPDIIHVVRCAVQDVIHGNFGGPSERVRLAT